MFVVTGATGKLGRLVIDSLLRKVPAEQVAVAVRNPAKAADIGARGVAVREADYARPDTLGPALQGASTLLLISSSEVGRRFPQHAAVIAAAKAAGVGRITYTSLLRAPTSRLGLAAEHLATEKALQASGLPHTILRNGWYIENYTENLEPALKHGVLLGSAGRGRIAAAARRDFAEAAVAVLTTPGHDGKAYELAGDRAFTMADLAAEVGRAAGRPVTYQDLPPDAYRKALLDFGVSEPFADLLVDSDVGISNGELDGASSDMVRLIGRPTTPLSEIVEAAVKAAGRD